MKKPLTPPFSEGVPKSLLGKGIEAMVSVMVDVAPVDEKGRYLHWDKLRHLPAPKGLASELWWWGIKQARKKLHRPLPLADKQGRPMVVAIPDCVHRELHWLDLNAAGSIQADEAIDNPQSNNSYLIRSLIEEAVNSSQLEGASTTRDVAKEMIRQDRPPRTKGEQMIFNNYQAMEFIQDVIDQPLTPSIVFELHRIVTEATLDEESVGRFRTDQDDIHVVDNTSQERLHTPPDAASLPARLDALCAFANQGADVQDEGQFLHPVVRAICLHFMLAYDHPFCDGNGRTARALFYWAMAKRGYWLMKFVSLSREIKKAPSQYGRAFLYSETDDNDLTYFVFHQLEVIHKAIDALHTYLKRKTQDINEAKKRLKDNPRLNGKLNFRQLALLRHALAHPRFNYVVREHQRSHGISYDVARKDLLQMADELALLLKTKRGKSYYFLVPDDLEQRIAAKPRRRA